MTLWYNYKSNNHNDHINNTSNIIIIFTILFIFLGENLMVVWYSDNNNDTHNDHINSANSIMILIIILLFHISGENLMVLLSAKGVGTTMLCKQDISLSKWIKRKSSMFNSNINSM